MREAEKQTTKQVSKLPLWTRIKMMETSTNKLTNKSRQFVWLIRRCSLRLGNQMASTVIVIFLLGDREGANLITNNDPRSWIFKNLNQMKFEWPVHDLISISQSPRKSILFTDSHTRHATYIHNLNLNTIIFKAIKACGVVCLRIELKHPDQTFRKFDCLVLRKP